MKMRVLAAALILCVLMPLTVFAGGKKKLMMEK